jgi:hypothetical protein
MLLRKKSKNGGGSGNGRNVAEFDLHVSGFRRLRGKKIDRLVVLRGITDRIRMEEGAGFVQKPYCADYLLSKIRSVLDGSD